MGRANLEYIDKYERGHILVFLCVTSGQIFDPLYQEQIK